MKRKYLFVAGTIVIIGAVVFLTFTQVRSVRSGPQASTPTPHVDGYQTTQFNESIGTFLPTVPTVAPEKYTDLSPELSVDKKVAVEIRHEDGTRERYDIARSMLNDFIKRLPQGDALIQISPIYPASGGYALPTFAELSPTPTPTYGRNTTVTIVLPEMPTAEQPKITDLAPDIRHKDKPSVVVEHGDGSREMFLLAPDAMDAFLKNLPKGDKLSVVIPPPSASMTHEAP